MNTLNSVSKKSGAEHTEQSRGVKILECSQRPVRKYMVEATNRKANPRRARVLGGITLFSIIRHQ